MPKRKRLEPEKVRIFVGASAGGVDAEAQAVLEYSIAKHASVPFEIKWMIPNKHNSSSLYYIGQGGWPSNHWPRPYTGFKWMVPSRCDFKGRALYFDTDVIVLGDIAELYNVPLEEGQIAATMKFGPAYPFTCGVWDCEAAKKHVSDAKTLMQAPDTHQSMMLYLAGHPKLVNSNLSSEWGARDGDLPMERKDWNGVAAFSCQRMGVQPYMMYAIPRLFREKREHWFDDNILRHPNAEVTNVFQTLLAEASTSGYPVTRYL